MSLYQPHHSLRGHFVVHGLFFQHANTRQHTRAQVINWWSEGSSVYEYSQFGYALLWAAPQAMDSRHVRALLIQATGDGYSCIPGSKASANSLLMSVSGQHIEFPLDKQQLVDPADWLDAGQFDVVQPQTVNDATVKLVEPKKITDTRNVLADIPMMHEGVKEMSDALSGKGGRGDMGVSGNRGMLYVTLSKLLRRNRSKKDISASGSGYGTNKPAALPKPRRRLKLSEWILKSQLADVLGKRQARYMSRLMQMLDDGDVEDALKHAVPLGGESGSWQGFSWGLPSPRANTNIGGRTHGSRSMLVGGTSVHEMLRQRYRNLANRLEQRGELDRAAFVLAELLDVPAEAVSLLERHGELKKAAEIAELKQLPPGLVIRQWFIAGDKKRALLIAHRTGRFADALLRMEKSDPKAAKSLRTTWAHQQASAGNYLQACEVIWPVESERRSAKEWLHIGIEAGGAPAASLLVKRLQLNIEGDEERYASYVKQLCTNKSADMVEARHAYLDAMLANTGLSETLQPMLKHSIEPLLRTCLYDYGQGLQEVIARRQLERLARQGGSVALLADWPKTDDIEYTTSNKRITIAPSSAGIQAIHDYVLLPSGSCLIAHGDAGVEVRNQRRRLLRRFEAPAHQLVISDNGTRAIAIGKRDERARITLLHLDTGESTDFGDIELDHHSDTFDGVEWFISRKDQVLALSLLGTALSITWQVSDLGKSGVYALKRNPKNVWLLAGDEDMQRWRYELPGMNLRTRESIPDNVDSALDFMFMLDSGDVLGAWRDTDDTTEIKARDSMVKTTLWANQRNSSWKALPPSCDDALAVNAVEGNFAVACQSERDILISMHKGYDFQWQFDIAMQGSIEKLRMRFFNGQLHIADNTGRYFSVSIETRKLIYKP